MSACVALALLAAPLASASDSLDPTFGQSGVSLVTPLQSAGALSLAEAGDGRLIVGGSDSFQDFVVARYNEDGSLDPTFGNVGIGGIGYTVTHVGFGSGATAVAVQTDGRVLAGGAAPPGLWVLQRHLASGELDRAFGTNGTVYAHGGVNGGGVLDLAIQSDARILVAGYGRTHHGWMAMLLRYRPDGTLDRSFGSSGEVRFRAHGEARADFKRVIALRSGKILLAGDLGGRLMAVRLLANGRPDSSFGGGDGFVLLDPDGSLCDCAYATGLALDRHGRIVVAVNLTGPGAEPAALFRLRADGRLDRGFGHRGVARTFIGSRFAGRDLVVTRSGRIVLVGAYNVPGSGEARVAVARYLANGRLDPGFARSGLFLRDFGLESTASAAVAQVDGGVVVAGRANTESQHFPELDSIYDGASFFLVRFKP